MKKREVLLHLAALQKRGTKQREQRGFITELDVVIRAAFRDGVSIDEVSDALEEQNRIVHRMQGYRVYEKA